MYAHIQVYHKSYGKCNVPLIVCINQRVCSPFPGFHQIISLPTIRRFWSNILAPCWHSSLGAHSAYLNLSNLKRDADLSGKSFELIIWCQAKMFIKCWKLHISAPDVRFNIRSTQYPIILIIISTRLSTIQPIQWST